MEMRELSKCIALVSAPLLEMHLISPSWPKIPPDAPTAGLQQLSFPGVSEGGGPGSQPLSVATHPGQLTNDGTPALPLSCRDQSGHRQLGVGRWWGEQAGAGLPNSFPQKGAQSSPGVRRPLCLNKWGPGKRRSIWEDRALYASLTAGPGSQHSLPRTCPCVEPNQASPDRWGSGHRGLGHTQGAVRRLQKPRCGNLIEEHRRHSQEHSH